MSNPELGFIGFFVNSLEPVKKVKIMINQRLNVTDLR